MFAAFFGVAAGEVVDKEFVNLVQYTAIDNALTNVLQLFVLGGEPELEKHDYDQVMNQNQIILAIYLAGAARLHIVRH